MSNPPLARPAQLCWCGATDLVKFSADYRECRACGTLVRKDMPREDLTAVTDARVDLYGRDYYERHLVEELGQPTLFERMRFDLPERCLHWLGTVTKYGRLGGRLLEIGCGHGASVALFQAAGFQAVGLELSPWLVELARQAWQIDARAGAVEKQGFPPASFDLIALFDVLEHLQNPRATLKECARLLAPGGVLIIQTPEHIRGRSHNSLKARKDPFLSLLIPEHLYLFTKDSARQLLTDAGLPHLQFEPAIFAHYDQYFVASSTPPSVNEPASIEGAMLSSPAGRFAQGLLDLDRQKHKLTERVAVLESFEQQVGAQSRQLALLDQQLQEVNALARSQAEAHLANNTSKEVSTLRAQLSTLVNRIKNLETDCAGRLEQVHTLTERIHLLEPDAAARLDQIHALTALVQASEEEKRSLRDQIQSYSEWLKDARGTVETITAAHCEAEKRVRALQEELSGEAALAASASQPRAVKTNGQSKASGPGDNEEVLRARLRAAHAEVQLALAQLRRADHGRHSPPPEPIPILPISFAASSIEEIECHLETLQQDTHGGLVSGWAFPRSGKIQGEVQPNLLIVCGESWFVVSGRMTARPDVAAAFPRQLGATDDRFLFGIVFRFSCSSLPSAITTIRVLLADAEHFRGVSRPFPFTSHHG